MTVSFELDVSALISPEDYRRTLEHQCKLHPLRKPKRAIEACSWLYARIMKQGGDRRPPWYIANAFAVDLSRVLKPHPTVVEVVAAAVVLYQARSTAIKEDLDELCVQF